MDPIVAYLKTYEFLENKTGARILRLKAARYVIYGNKLYRRLLSITAKVCDTF